MAAAGDGKGEASGKAGQSWTEPTLEELLKSMNLKGEDIGGVFVPKSEVEALKEETKWMAVMRLLTTKPFSATSLKKTMRFTWAPAQEVSFRDVEANRFLVQANCLGDWKKITEQGPWLFREQGLLIKKYDGSCSAKAVELNMIQAWAQIHDVPELYRKRHLVAGLAERLGEVLMVDMNGAGFEGGNYVRVRVWLDVRKRLTAFVSFDPEGEAKVIMRVRYEKIPRYCGVCGLLGHEQDECGTGEHAQEAIKYGTWLMAESPWNWTRLHGDIPKRPMGRERQNDSYGTPGRGAGRAGRGGREGGRGRGGGPENRKRSSTDARLTEVSPVKTGVVDTSDKGPLLLGWKDAKLDGSPEGSARTKLNFEEKDTEMAAGRGAPEGVPPPPPSAREPKHTKKLAAAKKDKSVTGVAASASEGRQSQ
jgi:hypothetical protein